MSTHVDRRHSTPGPGRRRIDSRKSEANPESRDQRRNRRFLLICHRIDRRASFVDDTRALLMLMRLLTNGIRGGALNGALLWETIPAVRLWRVCTLYHPPGSARSTAIAAAAAAAPAAAAAAATATATAAPPR